MSEETKDLTKEELYDKAQELDIEGRSTMDKEELAAAVEAAEANPESQPEHGQSETPPVDVAETQDSGDKAGGFQPQTVADGHGQAQAGFDPEPGPEANDSGNIKTVAEEYEEQHERRKAREAEIEETVAKAERTPF